jgi:hypothetical protein
MDTQTIDAAESEHQRPPYPRPEIPDSLYAAWNTNTGRWDGQSFGHFIVCRPDEALPVGWVMCHVGISPDRFRDLKDAAQAVVDSLGCLPDDREPESHPFRAMKAAIRRLRSAAGLPAPN